MVRDDVRDRWVTPELVDAGMGLFASRAAWTCGSQLSGRRVTMLQLGNRRVAKV